ncbi:hypothetical protein AB0K05_24790 [Nonomuraea sp. NPDC049486]|uniref:hypothetical protein n=1 Tax=Nonomuraea sp. NPDC049486 TaxID=3155773 RepID=UPI0034322EB8
MRSRAGLVAEVREARERCVQYAAWLEQARQQTERARRQRDEVARERGEAVRKLAVAERRVAGLTDTIEVLGEPDRSVRGPSPRTPAQELLQCRAHVEALERRLHELTSKSMAADQR